MRCVSQTTNLGVSGSNPFGRATESPVNQALLVISIDTICPASRLGQTLGICARWLPQSAFML